MTRPYVGNYFDFLAQKEAILQRVREYEDLSMQETIELRDPLVKRRLYKSSPEYRKKKERLLKYPETRGIKPKFPGYDPDFYRNKEAREFLEWKRRPIHLKKYADQYKSLVESAKDVVEGPQRPPQPLYVWKEGSWDVYSDVPPKGGIAYKRTYHESMEPYWAEVQRLRREEAKKRLLAYRIMKRKFEARRKLMRSRGQFILSDEPLVY